MFAPKGPRASARALANFIGDAGCSFQDAAPREVLERTMDFYARQGMRGLAVDPQSDMLLFQYGCYDWVDGKGERFEVDLVRQFIAADRAETISQLHVTLYFAPDPALRRLGSNERWCENPADLAAFREAVLRDLVIEAMQSRSTVERRVRWELV